MNENILCWVDLECSTTKPAKCGLFCVCVFHVEPNIC
jgi:hypothetical protein